MIVESSVDFRLEVSSTLFGSLSAMLFTKGQSPMLGRYTISRGAAYIRGTQKRVSIWIVDLEDLEIRGTIEADAEAEAKPPAVAALDQLGKTAEGLPELVFREAMGGELRYVMGWYNRRLQRAHERGVDEYRHKLRELIGV